MYKLPDNVQNTAEVIAVKKLNIGMLSCAVALAAVLVVSLCFDFVVFKLSCKIEPKVPVTELVYQEKGMPECYSV